MSFSWSYSKLKSFETCPKRHYEVDLKKNYREKVDPDGPLAWGNRVHEAIAEALTQHTPLPKEMAPYQKWVDAVYAGTGELLVEQKLAITREFEQCAWFAPGAWYRGIADVLRIDGPVALAVDWKTGTHKEGSGEQLMLLAQCVFVHYPEVERVRTAYIWLQDNIETATVYSRKSVAEQWASLFPRVDRLEGAAVNFKYPPNPSGLCVRYCPVSSCTYHGRGTR